MQSARLRAMNVNRFFGVELMWGRFLCSVELTCVMYEEGKGGKRERQREEVSIDKSH